MEKYTMIGWMIAVLVPVLAGLVGSIIAAYHKLTEPINELKLAIERLTVTVNNLTVDYVEMKRQIEGHDERIRYVENCIAACKKGGD